MALQLQQAQRSKAYLKLGMSAPSGGGKTLGALLIGYGLMKEKYKKESDEFLWSKIAVIDTENGSGQLYVGRDIADVKIGIYNTITLTAPFEAEKYIKSVDICEQAGMEVCIIDSTTHLWSGEGGLLEQQNAAAKRGGNSYTAWRDITPQHNHFVEKMLQTPMHVIATMRSKQEYVQEKGQDGKTTIRKVGLEPEQRKGMEYEFTIFFEVNAEHEAFGAKDRTSVFDQKTFKITPRTGQEIMKWLEGGTTAEPVIIATLKPAAKDEAVATINKQIIDKIVELGGSKNTELMEMIKTDFAKDGNVNSIKDEEKLKALLDALNDFEKKHLVEQEQLVENSETK